MDPDDLMMARLAALLAAVVVNAGTGKAPADVLAEAALYEPHVLAVVTPPA